MFSKRGQVVHKVFGRKRDPRSGAWVPSSGVLFDRQRAERCKPLWPIDMNPAATLLVVFAVHVGCEYAELKPYQASH